MRTPASTSSARRLGRGPTSRWVTMMSASGESGVDRLPCLPGERANIPVGTVPVAVFGRHQPISWERCSARMGGRVSGQVEWGACLLKGPIINLSAGQGHVVQACRCIVHQALGHGSSASATEPLLTTSSLTLHYLLVPCPVSSSVSCQSQYWFSDCPCSHVGLDRHDGPACLCNNPTPSLLLRQSCSIPVSLHIAPVPMQGWAATMTLLASRPAPLGLLGPAPSGAGGPASRHTDLLSAQQVNTTTGTVANSY
jgi:hypothetical protein